MAWLLRHTNLDVEGRVLRLPFPCFALVFTDRATLELAESLLPRQAALHIVTAYVRASPAPRGATGLHLSLVVDDQSGRRPPVIARELRFSEDDDIDDILAGTGGARAILHVVVSAILYATSANVRWPIAPSPIRALRARAAARGKAKRARIAHRAQELGKTYSHEDVFFLPGRIPISQLRELQRVEREPTGEMLMARFLVRGHWRRAARGWADQRVRWIEPYWKGPELGRSSRRSTGSRSDRAVEIGKRAFVAACLERSPDALVTDTRMPVLCGLEHQSHARGQPISWSASARSDRCGRPSRSLTTLHSRCMRSSGTGTVGRTSSSTRQSALPGRPVTDGW